MRFSITILLTILTTGMSGQATFVSNADGDWAASGSWTLLSGTDLDGNGIPDADDDVTISSAHTISIPDMTTAACLSLDIQGSGVLDLAGNLDVFGMASITSTGASLNMTSTSATLNPYDLLITEGSFIANGLIIIPAVMGSSGALTVQGGLADIQHATVILDGDVAISGGELTLTNGLSILSTAMGLILSGGELDHNDGSLTLNTEGIITGGILSIDSDFTVVGGDLRIQGGTTTEFISGSTEIGDSLIVDSSQLLTISSDLDVGTAVINGTVRINGNFGSKIFGNITVNSGGTWDVTVSEDFFINGNLTNDGTWTGCASTSGCDYFLNGSSGTISGSALMNNMSGLTIDGVASYTNTNSGGLHVTDYLMGSGSFSNGTNGHLLVSGSSSGFSISTFTASATGNTVTYSNPTADQLLRQTSDAGNNYHNLIIDKTGGSFNVTTDSDITIDNQLTLTHGDIELGGQDLILSSAANLTGGNADSYIQQTTTGVFRRFYTTNDSFFLPIGTSSDYLPITITMNSAIYAMGAFIDFSLSEVAHPNRDDANTGIGGDDQGIAATAYLNRYWTLSATGITSPRFDATYEYSNSNVTGSGMEADMVPGLYRNHPVLTIPDWLALGTVDPVNNIVSFTDADAFGDFYAMDNTMERLPISLLSFAATPRGNQVKIEWTTAAEQNNSFFSIERSLNTSSFETIGRLAGAGDSDIPLDYVFTDLQPVAGRSYYRLKQTDYNGNYSYSELSSVWLENPKSIRIYPNPVQRGNSINIEFPSISEPTKVEISLFTALGALKYQNTRRLQTHESSLEISISAEHTIGLYYLILQFQDQRIKKTVLLN